MIVIVYPVRSDNLDFYENLKEAEIAIKDRMYEIAEKRCMSVIENSYASEEAKLKALILLGNVFYESGQFKRIFSEFPPKGIKVTDRVTSIVTYWQAEALKAEGAYQQALNRIQNFKEGIDENIVLSVMRLKAWCLAKLGNKEAVEVWNSIFDKVCNSSDYPEYIVDALSSFIGGNFSNEVELITTRIKELGVDSIYRVKANLLLAGFYRRAGNIKKSQSIIEEMLKQKDIIKGEYLLKYQILYIENLLDLGNIEMAGKELEQIGEVDTMNFSYDTIRDLSYLKVRYQIISGKFDKARSLLEEIVSTRVDDPRAPYLYVMLAEAVYRNGHYTDALNIYDIYEKAFTNVDLAVSLLVGKAKCFFKLGKYKQSADLFIKASNIIKDKDLKKEYLNAAAESFLLDGNLVDAKKVYMNILDIGGTNETAVNVIFKLVDILKQEKNFTEAEKWLGIVKRMEKLEYSQRKNADFLYADIFLQQGRWQEAYLEFENILNSATNNADVSLKERALLGGAIALYRMYKFEDALQKLENITGSDIEIAKQALYMKAVCYYAVWKDEEAIKCYNRFLEIYSSDNRWIPFVRFWLGEYFYNRKEYKTAYSNFIAIADFYPHNQLADNAMFWAARALFNNNEYEEASKLFSLLCKKTSDPALMMESRYHQAESLIKLDKYNEALVILDTILTSSVSGSMKTVSMIRKGDCLFMMASSDPSLYSQSMDIYKTVLNEVKNMKFATKLEIEYKIGKCLERKEKINEAIEQYYGKIVLPFTAANIKEDKEAELWFVKAAFDAVSLLERTKQWHQAVNILERIAEMDIEASHEANIKAKNLKQKYRWIFY